jgi:hypothetical protein
VEGLSGFSPRSRAGMVEASDVGMVAGASCAREKAAMERMIPNETRAIRMEIV